MTNSKLISRLYQLAQLDIQALHACEEANKKIDNVRIFNNVNEIRNIHIKNIHSLSAEIKRLGGRPPLNSKNNSSSLEGFVSLQNVNNMSSILKAIKANENLISKSYEAVLNEKELPVNIRTVLKRCYRYEKMHLRYINDVIESVTSH